MEIPKEPVIFFKSDNCAGGPNDALVIPKNAMKVDWEVELAVVMEKRAITSAGRARLIMSPVLRCTTITRSAAFNWNGEGNG